MRRNVFLTLVPRMIVAPSSERHEESRRPESINTAEALARLVYTSSARIFFEVEMAT